MVDTTDIAQVKEAFGLLSAQWMRGGQHDDALPVIIRRGTWFHVMTRLQKRTRGLTDRETSWDELLRIDLDAAYDDLDKAAAADAALRRARWRLIGTMLIVVILLVVVPQLLIRPPADPAVTPAASIPAATADAVVDLATATPIAATPPAETPTPEPTLAPLRRGTVATAGGQRANLRATPSTDGAILAKLDAGADVILLEQVGEWWRVQAVAGQGWLLATLIVEQENKH